MAGQAGAAVQAARLQAMVQTSTARRVAAVEEERRRIRRDLHDGLGPTLAGIGLGIETAGRRVEEADDPATADLLARLRDETQAAITSIRGLVYGLRPPALDELGLAGALQTALVEPGGMRVDLHVEGLTPEVRLPAAVEVAAYRIAVEAVANAARHAGATTCLVEVVNNGVLTVSVTDDGHGLPDGWRAGVGITSMRERAGELGGTLILTATADGGTRVLATLPITGLAESTEQGAVRD
jgi:signal transduction histidine kinase